MRLHEIIQTQLGPRLSYDPTRHRLEIKPEPSLSVKRTTGEMLVRKQPDPPLLLKQLNRIKKLRRQFLAQREKTLKLRSLMYGGGYDAKRAELDTAQAELEKLARQLDAEVQSAELDAERKAALSKMAMRYIKKS